MRRCRGNDVPVVHDDGLLVGSCDRAQGGTKTIGIPAFKLTVPPGTDLIWRDDDFQLVLEEPPPGEFIIIDNS